MQALARTALVAATAAGLAVLAGCAPSTPAKTSPQTRQITQADFGCMRDLTPVGRFYVGNLAGNVEETVRVAQSATGGPFPVGSVVQLVPTEVMIKREAGFSAATNDWEFFELDVGPQGSAIRRRGHVDVVNRFGGNCLECHAKAGKQWDMICSTDHGCDPIPLTDDMIRALQKTDPRCPPAALTDAESEALKSLLQFTAPTPAEP